VKFVIKLSGLWVRETDSRALDGLMGALKDEDAGVRQQAAWALGQIESTRSTAALCAR